MKKIIMGLLFVLCVNGNGAAFELDQLRVHGFASQGYLHSSRYNTFFGNTEEGTVEFNEFGVNFSSPLTDRLHVGIQFLSRRLGTFTPGDVTVDWAFGDYRYRNWLGVRAGKMKRAGGLYNQIWDLDVARTAVLLPPSIYDETMRESLIATTGLELYGTLPGGFRYQGQYGMLTISPKSSIAEKLGRWLQVDTTNIDVEESLNLHLEWDTPLAGLKLGGNLLPSLSWQQTTTLGTLDFDVSQFIISAEYVFHALTCAVEYQQIATQANLGDQRIMDFTGEYYYGMLSYRFSDWFELASYYSVSYPDKNDKDGQDYVDRGQPAALDWHKDLAVSARFDINDYWLVKLEGHFINGLFEVPDFGENPDEEWFMFAVKTTFTF
jgi:hypothetical protein